MYSKESSVLAYSEIPDKKDVKQSFKRLVEIIKSEQ
jgi:hypothetical protein